MVIVDRTGQRRERRLSSWFKAGENDDDKSLVRFDEPADVRGTALLTIEHGEKDDQWLYLPDLRKTKKIAGASKSLSFAGTDFANCDMRTEDLAGHDYERTGSEDLGGRACWIIEAKPKTDEKREETGYARRRIWVDKERATIPKVEYYDKNGKLLKISTAEDWEEVEGLWRPNRVTMENVQEKTKTIIAYDRGSRKINKGIEDSFFSKRTLEKP
jgi:outer membrane lipoprotein-sorting protein